MNFLLSRTTIKTRLIVGFALLLVAALVSAAIGYRVLDEVASRVAKANQISRLSLTLFDARAEERTTCSVAIATRFRKSPICWRPRGKTSPASVRPTTIRKSVG